MLPHAMEVLDAWGFEFKTRAFCWAKRNKVGPGFFTGMGFWTRANPEDCWLAVRGSPKRQNAGVKRLIVDRRREHSRKPDCVYGRIETLVPGPYCEMFSRAGRRGWDAMGDEIGKFPEVDDLI
jgi:N6-adenosine-specific RNA methylase IME4